jgi:signal transduction histidine kinase
MRRRSTLEFGLRGALARWFGGVAGVGGLLVAAATLVALRGGLRGPNGELGTTGVVTLALLALGLLVFALGTRLAARRIARGLLVPLARMADDARRISPGNPGGRIRLAADALELRHLEEELNTAVERMEGALHAQAQFAGNVAHELRTPIAALMADAQVSRLGERNVENAFAFLDRAEGELRHLSELVESFLVLARVDAHEERKDLVYVDDVIRRAASRCAAWAGRQGVALVVRLGASPSCDPFVRGDSQLLQAMLENLLNNAIRHSPRGSEVTIRSACVTDTIVISVSDRGVGIPAELRAAVFERGFRAPDMARETSGAGLGLAIVSSVARLHEGRVELENEEGGGCRFVVTLPLAPEALTNVEHSEDAAPATCGP